MNEKEIELKDLQKRITKLKAELNSTKAEEHNLFLQQIEIETGLKIGDVIEYVCTEWVNDYDKEDFWNKARIKGFEKTPLGLIQANCEYTRLTLTKESKWKKYDEHDYSLRHYLWGDRELDLEEMIQIIADDIPRLTKGKLYAIYKIVKQRDEQIEYWVYNDKDQPQTIYEGQFHVTQNKND